jgi:hypothetical protein
VGRYFVCVSIGSAAKESDRRKEFLFGVAYSMGLRSDLWFLLC